MSDDTIAVIKPGETVGPFEIVIPREVAFLAHFNAMTTRWERFRLRAHLMRRARRRSLYERLRPWFDAYGWD